MKALLCFLAALLTVSSHAGVGDLIGYEEIESTLRARFFVDAPFCVGTPEHVKEFKRIDDSRDPITLKIEEINFWFAATDELGLKPGFILTAVLGDFKPQKTSMAHLLGTRYYPDVISLPLASNHVVNSQNLYAWDLVLTELAKQLGAVCEQVDAGEKAPTLTLKDESLLFEECRVRKVPINAELTDILARVCVSSKERNMSKFEADAEELFDLSTGFQFSDGELKAWLEAMSDSLTREPKEAKSTVTLMFRTIFLNPFFFLQH